MGRLKLFWTNQADIFRIIELLSEGEVVLGTSDTVLGLLSTLTPEGFNSLNMLKGRNEKPYIVLIGDKRRIADFAQTPLNPKIQAIIDCCWPGPLTLIMKAQRTLAPYIQSKNSTVALRMPGHHGLLELLKEFDGLFSTSANKAGQPVPFSINEVHNDIADRVSAIVMDTPQKHQSSTIRPSTILDCTHDNIKVIREGTFSTEYLEHLIGQEIK